MYVTKESVTWCYVKTLSKSMYFMYLRRRFHLINSTSFQRYIAVGSVSWWFHSCIDHENVLANHNFIICNSFKVNREPKYLHANHEEGASQQAIFPNTKPRVGRSNHLGSRSVRCDARQHKVIDTSMPALHCPSCTLLCSPMASVVCQKNSS